MALECVFILCILLCCIVSFCVVCVVVFVVSWLLALACVCVLSNIDIDWFHTHLSFDKYWICEYVYVCVCLCVCNGFFEDWEFCFRLYKCHI